MRIDLAKLSQQLVLVVVGGGSLRGRRAADRRRANYHTAFGLRADAACLLDQMAEARGALIHRHDAVRTIGRRGQVVDLRPRSPELCMMEIREKMGSDSIETVRDCSWRLTPLGRLRAMRALGFKFTTEEIGLKG